MRKFEKISFNQFKKDIADDKELYDSIELPKRKTKYSAGYDITSVNGGIIKPGCSMIFKTGLKSYFESDEVLYIIVRSSIGFKNDTTLSNSVAVIDADYYNNENNEGHILVKLINHGKEDIEIKVGDRIAQGIFMKYLTFLNEEEIVNERNGGVGSTNRKEKK